MPDIYSVEQYPSYKQQALLEEAHRAQLVRAVSGQHSRWRWLSAVSRITRGWFSRRQPVSIELDVDGTITPAPTISNAH